MSGSGYTCSKCGVGISYLEAMNLGLCSACSAGYDGGSSGGSGYTCSECGAGISRAEAIDGIGICSACASKRNGSDTPQSADDPDATFSYGTNVYEEVYNGNRLFIDQNMLTEACRCLNSISDEIDDLSMEILLADSFFASVPDRYNCLIPNPRYADIKSQYVNLVEEACDDFLSKLSAINDAISDYASGDGFTDPANEALIKYYLSEPKFLYDPVDPGIPKDPDIEEPDVEEPEGEDIDNELGDSEIPDTIGNNNYQNAIYDDALVPRFEVLDEADLLSEDAENAILDADTLGNSLFKGAISIPGPLVGNFDGFKSGGVLGATGIAIAVATAIGGKVFYDKRKENDDYIDEDVVDLNDETGSAVGGSFMSGIGAVEFKSDLLEKGVVRE